MDTVTKHTPGPWVAVAPKPAARLAHTIVGPNKRYVAHVQIWAHNHASADVRLIVAAPELLEALQGVTVALEQLVDIEHGSPAAYSVAKARAAIAKATGGAL